MTSSQSSATPSEKTSEKMSENTSSEKTSEKTFARSSAKVDKTPVYELRDIYKRFGPVTALRGANLTLHEGEVLGLVGDNGAGKSTLMKVASGTVVPDDGDIYLGGEPVLFRAPSEARAQHVEMVYQDLSLCNSLSVANNLFLGREPTRDILGLKFLDHKTLHQKAKEILESLHIRIPSTRATVRNLSGGQRQSVAIGRAVSFNPRVLILDEPTAALAVKEVDEVLNLIRRLSDEGVGVILITHRLQDVMSVTDRIAVMYEGRTVAERETSETSIEEVVDLIVQA